MQYYKPALQYYRVAGLVSDMPIFLAILARSYVDAKIVSEYDQEIPQSQTAEHQGTARKSHSTITRH